MGISRTHIVDVVITTQELAAAFCEMDSEEQAAFFAAIKPITDQWPGTGLCSQSYFINRDLDIDGRVVLETLASHLPKDVLERLASSA